MSKEFLIQKILKPEVELSMWRPSIKNVFRYSLHETDAHIFSKFKRFHYWRRNGADVFTELVLNKQNKGLRPDIVVVLNNQVFIEEIVASEKEASIIKKRKDYPFTIVVVNAKDNNLL